MGTNKKVQSWSKRCTNTAKREKKKKIINDEIDALSKKRRKIENSLLEKNKNELNPIKNKFYTNQRISEILEIDTPLPHPEQTKEPIPEWKELLEKKSDKKYLDLLKKKKK